MVASRWQHSPVISVQVVAKRLQIYKSIKSKNTIMSEWLQVGKRLKCENFDIAKFIIDAFPLDKGKAL